MKKIIFIYCIVLFVVVAYPLFLSTGNMFALDYVPNTTFDVPLRNGTNLYLLNYLHFLLGGKIPVFIWERIIFFLTFFLAMFGGYMLLRKTKNIYAILFGLTLIIINPFFYERIVDGQVNVYLASAGMIVYISLLQQLFKKPSYKNAFIAGIGSLFLTLVSIYVAYLIALASCIFLMVYGIGSVHKKTMIWYSIVFSIVTLVVNSFWAGPIIQGYFLQDKIYTTQEISEKSSRSFYNAITTHIEDFGIESQKAFATVSGEYGLYINVFMMKGYWSEQYKRFLPSQGLNPWYALIMACIGGLVLLGIWTCCIQKNPNSKKISYTLLILGVLGYILSLGTSQENIFSPMNAFLYEYFPLYNGFREPHKWIIFLIIAYGYFGGYGVRKIYDSLEGSFVKEPIMISIILLPLLSTPSMLGGFSNQLTVKHFPQEWEEIHTYTQTNIVTTSNCDNEKTGGACYTFLYFPWHQYLGFEWLEKIVYSGILHSITFNNLIGDNIEVGNIYSQSDRQESTIIEHYIGPGGTLKNYATAGGDAELTNFKKDISDLGIQYIVLLKEADYGFYKSFLDSMVDKGLLSIEKKNSMITLYKNIK